MIQCIAGIIIGGIVGVFAMSLCSIAGQADDNRGQSVMHSFNCGKQVVVVITIRREKRYNVAENGGGSDADSNTNTAENG